MNVAAAILHDVLDLNDFVSLGSQTATSITHTTMKSSYYLKKTLMVSILRICTLPDTRRNSGRPKKRSLRSSSVEKFRITLFRFRPVIHNKRTCNEIISTSISILEKPLILTHVFR